MRRSARILVTILLVVFFISVVGGLLIGLGFLSGPLLLLILLGYGWMLYAFLHYRAGRQDEFLFVIAAAAESGTPLAPAVRAYAHDRPHSGWHEFWIGFLQFFIFPGYYWIWHKRTNFERKVNHVANLLEDGTPLGTALQSVPGVASRSTILAVAVGESTGQLALSLRRSAQGEVATAWIEALPRLLYPVALLFVMSAITGFWALYIEPRFERMFHDFGVELPEMTRLIAGVRLMIENDTWIWNAGVFLFVMLVACTIFSPGIRWYIPGVGRLYRMIIRSRVMKMLGVLLESGKPVPEALTVLEESDSFPTAIVGKIVKVRKQVEQGQPLPDSLYKGGLLTRAMIPLVRAAEKAQNLPWALTELGESLAKRAMGYNRRLSLTLFVLAIIAISALIGYVVVGIFMPLIKLITELS